MPFKRNQPILVQCDFDGTVTIGDVSFQILDEFTGTGWRQLFQEYMQGKMTVNHFNATAFSRVKADKETLENFVRQKAVIRPGLPELLKTCRERDFRFTIVSNGMMFYIDAILKMLGMNGVEFVAGRSNFKPEGVEAWYEGPDGKPLEDGFKEAYTRNFLKQGYRIVYIGNGASDFAPARLCSHIFSIDNLSASCKEAGVAHSPFTDLHEVADGLKKLD
ncbi:MAG: 2,3-diketo-5-methylthio-1-phosphopentane phosphatase [Dehalococcoidia bacterium]|nr:MAG: 2,3-diketo-5-methylthio-1-phosphopentane phosphatase [Dehalococcoidia bacterium]